MIASEALGFIDEITHAMNQTEEPRDLLNRILQASIDMSQADGGSIMLLDKDDQLLKLSASIGLIADQKEFHLQLGEGVTGWVAEHGKSRLVNDTTQDQSYIPLQAGLKSELAVPLMHKGELFGVLSVDAKRAGAFLPEHETILTILANLVAHIFIKVRDNKHLKLRDRFHRVMIDIGRVVTSSLALTEVFAEIMQITESAFRMQRSLLLLYDTDKDRLRIVASMGFEAGQGERIAYEPGEGIVGQVFLQKKAVFVPDTSKEPEFLNRLQVQSGSSEQLGFFCCPVFSGNEAIGVFASFTYGTPDLSSEHLLEFLEIVASFISQAVTIQKLLREKTRVIESENIKLKHALGEKYRFGNLIGKSREMLRLFETVQIVAESRATVLITGESGTGKELFASAIHYNSPRRDGPFVKINCAAIPESLLESELFGHKRGSFTGAVSDKDGKFVQAHQGTIFLDEIGEMDLNLQSKLLRVLQEKEVEPIGGKVRKVDIRVIAATNSELEAAVEARTFRADLFYRLNVIRLAIPPLRERVEDVLPLAQHFLKKYTRENNKDISEITQAAVQLLESSEWPGNIRQLENSIERAVVMCQNHFLDTPDFHELYENLESAPVTLEAELQNAPETVPGSVVADSGDWFANFIHDQMAGAAADSAVLDGNIYKLVVGELERRLILLALKRFRYTKIKAAAWLGINRNTLDKKIKELQIDY
ncbi:MAG: sigma 54-interacting transcriptional regulator [Leptospiraceae bacterium]|nr:sigma 54-interacting transcriptional regulator [Leptospiraceae bacterium]